jgi:hypothetical protein
MRRLTTALLFCKIKAPCSRFLPAQVALIFHAPPRDECSKILEQPNSGNLRTTDVRAMSALGHLRTWERMNGMSALPR